jgi:(2Fe-2S) ferredoxin
MEEISMPKKQLHILICVNDRSNVPISHKPDCGSKINHQDFLELKEFIKEKELTSQVKLTRTYCLGICPKHGFVMLVYPGQKYYMVDSISEIKEFIVRSVIPNKH